MPLGRKLWEEKGKVMGTSIKSAEPDKIVEEVTLTAEMKGFGRFPSGTNMGTITYLEGPIITKLDGPGYLATNDGESLPYHYSGLSKEVSGRSRSVGVLSFNTRSRKYAWMNGLRCLVDSASLEDGSGFSDTGYEWE